MTFSRVKAKFIVHYRRLFNEMLEMMSSYDLAPTWYANGWGSLESQRTRYEVISQLIPKTPIKILDVGCGMGWIPFNHQGLSRNLGNTNYHFQLDS